MSLATANEGKGPHLRELAFHFQPIFGTDRRHPAAYEALVRWPRADGTIRGPADFLGEFLHDDAIEAFTRFSLTSCCTLLATSPRAPRLHVNLAPRQLTLATTAHLLTRLRPAVRDRLVVELTEQRIPDLEAYAASIRVLADAGIRVLLDDVVPTDLPVRLPPHLPVAGVKVDRSVIPEVEVAPWGPDGRAVRRLAQRGMEVTAEGIETPSLVPRLREVGFSRFQGFGLATPCRSLEEALALHPPTPERAGLSDARSSGRSPL